MLQYISVFTFALLTFFAAPAIASDTVVFERTELCLVSGADEKTINVELATNPAQHRQGLMQRDSLPENEGMLFVYRQEASRAFWMFNTFIALDIAYISSNGVIDEILTMEPCEHRAGFRCRSYPSSSPFQYALEMNAGWFAENSVGVSDKVKAGDCDTHLRAMEL